MSIAGRLEREWQSGGSFATALRPVSCVYRGLLALRRFLYRAGVFKVVPSPLPVLVVGNLTVGGTGKTPLTAWLIKALRERGWNPAVVSRGYGAERRTEPHMITASDRAADVGDEPCLLHQSTGAPVCVCADRPRAVAEIARSTNCDIVLSDDGLQHIAMARDVEIVVVDAAARFGNGYLLPAGPLREPVSRLHDVDGLAFRYESLPELSDLIVQADEQPLPSKGVSVKGVRSLDQKRLPADIGFSLGHARIRPLSGGEWHSLADVSEPGRTIRAVAGIARPARFFALMRSHGYAVVEQSFPDHHDFVVEDLLRDDDLPIFVTSKDAVKLQGMSGLPIERISEVAVDVVADARAEDWLDALSEKLRVRADKIRSNGN